ncbi:secretion protein HlyD [Kocuria sp. TGY1127_2]|uniref:secretion protein HlyD n=1 Tax=Kocuria sp. TGY1127_2 TaxID=2711328 RepID=UPI0015C18A98|nr:secretion protein HlyD [Kocuria sp. TGY1127_2]
MKRKGLALFSAILVAVVVVTWIAASSFTTSAQKAADAEAPPPSTLTATITRDQLRKTVPVTCTSSYGSTFTVQAPPSEEGGQYTKIAVAPHEEIDQGSLLAEVNGKPLFAMIGRFSLYRDLRDGDRGPDAHQFNESLSALGLQGKRSGEARDLINAATYDALARLYKQFGYEPIDKKDAIPATSFQYLERPGKVIDEPRSTGPVSRGPIATLSAEGARLRCTGVGGQLTPEAGVGKRVTVPSLGTTEYAITEVVENTGSRHSGQEGRTGVAPNAGQRPTSSSGEGAGAQGAPQPVAQEAAGSKADEGSVDRAILVDVGPDIDKVHGTVTGHLILDESRPRQLVVPSSGLWTKDNETRVTVVDGQDTHDVPVRVLFSTDGKNAVEPLSGELSEGTTIRIGTDRGGEG